MSVRPMDQASAAADDALSSTQPIRGGSQSAASTPVEVVLPPSEALSDSRVILDRLTPGNPRIGAVVPALLRTGQLIGDYLIVEELARGGMGVIYKARQRSLNRIVALKVVLRGEFASTEEVLRFRTEAQAVASLHHPNLVSIFEIGEHAEMPFFAMEYLEGGPLSRRLSRQPLPVGEAVRLLLPLVQAIDYAHSRGIIHRDLKPANILLSSATEPLGECVAKITDFGIAKQLDQNTDLTRTGEILGTPAYMAPEQAAGTRHNVGPAADVYSLGAILYELLTGETPFPGFDSADILVRVLQEDATSPRARNAKVPVDLETICLKCLEKEPARRYTTAGALAEDLRRFLAHEPLLARPASWLERARKWVKRRPVWATVATACLLLLGIGIAALVGFWQQAEAKAAIEAEMVATKEENLVEVQTLLADALLDRGITCAEKHDIHSGLHWMIRSLEIAEQVRTRNPRAAALCEAIRYNLAYWSDYAAPLELELPHPLWAWTVDFSPDGEYAVTGCRDGNVRVWDAHTGRLVTAPLSHGSPVWAVCWHPAGNFLLSAGGENTGEIRVFRKKANTSWEFERCGLPFATQSSPHQISLSHDGKLLLILLRNGDLHLMRFDVDNDNPLQPLAAIAQQEIMGAHFSSDARKLFYITMTGQLVSFDVDRQTADPAPWQLDDPVTALAMSRTGERLVVATYNRDTDRSAIHLWDRRSGSKHLKIHECTGGVKCLALSPDASHLAVSAMLKNGKEFRGQLHITELTPRGETLPLYAPIELEQPIWALAFHQSGELLLTGCRDRHSRIFEVATGQPVAPPLRHEGNVTNLAHTADGRRLLTASSGGGPDAYARLALLPRLRLTPRSFGPEQPLNEMQWYENGTDLFAIDKAGKILQLHAGDGHVLRTIEVPLGSPRFASPQHLVSFEQGELHLRMVDLRTGSIVADRSGIPSHFHDAMGVHIGGRMPIYDRRTKTLALYRLEDGVKQGENLSLAMPPANLFAHEGSAIFGGPIFGGPVVTTVTIGSDHVIRSGSQVSIWDFNMTVRRTWKFPHHVEFASLSPRGDIMLVVGPQQLRLFNVATSEPIGRAMNHDGGVRAHCYHPTEPLVVVSSPRGTIRRWHLHSSKPIGKTIQLSEEARCLSARPDGTGYLAGFNNRRSIQWAHLGPKAGTPAELRTWVENLTGMTMSAQDELIPIDRSILTERRRQMAP